MVNEDVDRTKGLTNRLEAGVDLLGVGDVCRYCQCVITEVGRKLVEVVRRPSKEPNLTALVDESACERFTETGADTGDDCCSCHTESMITGIKTVFAECLLS
jgi:hypothetical protein